MARGLLVSCSCAIHPRPFASTMRGRASLCCGSAASRSGARALADAAVVYQYALVNNATALAASARAPLPPGSPLDLRPLLPGLGRPSAAPRPPYLGRPT